MPKRISSEFLSIAGHELRAPIQVVTLAHESIAHEGLSPAQRNLMQHAQDAIGELGELIDDLMDLGRLCNQESGLNYQPVCLSSLIDSTARGLGDTFANQDVRLILETDLDLPGPIRSDPVRLVQILRTLALNAANYPQTKSVVLRASLDTGVDEEQYLDASVHGDGIGLTQDQLKAVFQPFNAVGTARRRGTGLELAICQQLVLAMGGSIDVESVTDDGLTIRIRLPLEWHKDHAQKADHDYTAVLRQTNKIVLLVEKESLTHENLTSFLNERGFLVQKAANCAEAIELIKHVDFIAVVANQNAFDKNQHQLMQAVQMQASQGRPKPVLVGIRATAAPDSDGLAQRHFDTVLAKPIDLDQLHNAIECAADLVGAKTHR